MEFYSSVLTSAGADLITRAQLGTAEIAFTRISVGSGDYPEMDAGQMRDLLEGAASLKQERCSFGIADKEKVNDATLKLSWVMDNSCTLDGTPITAGFRATEIGIWAKDAKDAQSQEVLYGLAVAKPGKADWISAYNDLLPATTTIDLYVEVANAEEVTIVASPTVYALAEDLWELRGRFDNVEASQLMRTAAVIPVAAWTQVNGKWQAVYQKSWIEPGMVPRVFVDSESAETAYAAELLEEVSCSSGAVTFTSVSKPTDEIRAVILLMRPAAEDKHSRITCGELDIPLSAWTADLQGVHARITAEWIAEDMLPDVFIPSAYAALCTDCYIEAAADDGALLLSADRAPTGAVKADILCLRPSDAQYWAQPVAAMMPATAQTIGAVRIGSGLSVAPDGTLSVAS